MAKRPLGLGKSHEKARKLQKKNKNEHSVTKKSVSTEVTEKNASDSSDNVLITFADSELSEVAQLWVEYITKKITKTSVEDDRLLINAIIHECERLNAKLQAENAETDEEVKSIDGEFWAIYGLAIAELAYFLGDDKDTNEEEELEDSSEDEEVKNARTKLIRLHYKEAQKKIKAGMKKFGERPQDKEILETSKHQIMANRIPLQYISSMDMNSKSKAYPDINKLLVEMLEYKPSGKGKLIDHLYFSLLDCLSDVLDMVENFGINDDLEIDSDNEEDIDASNVKLAESHPLFEPRKTMPKHENLLISRLEEFQSSNGILTTAAAQRLGDLYQKKADEAGKSYTDYVYNDEASDNIKESSEAKTLQKLAIDRYKIAVSHLDKHQDPEDPASWVNVAEAEIALGNCCDLDSEEQESWYKKAEERLRKANKATNGKFEHILNDLLGE